MLRDTVFRSARFSQRCCCQKRAFDGYPPTFNYVTNHFAGDQAMNLRAYLTFALMCLMCQAGLAQEKTEAKEEVLKLAQGKILAIKPTTWKTMPPKSNIVQYEFKTPVEGDKTARITIMSAGGSIESNIERWVGQFEGAKKEDIQVEKKEVETTTVHIVEIAGTFKESMGGPFAPGGGKVTKMENYKMLGGILELKDGEKVFIKATGPAEIIGGMKEGFMKMLSEIKLQDAK
jgi:hypothetical protein